jgi:thymidylate synthase
MRQYHDLLRLVLEHGRPRMDRTWYGDTLGFRGASAFRSTAERWLSAFDHEEVASQIDHLRIAWFLRGDTNVRYLNEHGVTIWDEWADANGDLGRVYGAQWTNWRGPEGNVINQN